MKYVALTSSTLVIPDNGDWPLALGPGAVVVLLDVSPATLARCPIPREIFIGYVDVVGRPQAGWIAQRTPLTPTSSRQLLYSTYDPASPITAWDSLRERFAKRATPSWSFKTWGDRLKGADNLALVRLALRELGATCEEKAAASTLITALTRVIFTPQEVRSMSAEVTEVPSTTPASAKKPAAKKTASKKPAAKKAAPARSLARSVGQALKDAGYTSPVVSKLLKDEAVTKKQLTELRDAVNAKASAMRDADKGAAASKLSAANKLVRRLSRTK